MATIPTNNPPNYGTPALFSMSLDPNTTWVQVWAPAPGQGVAQGWIRLADLIAAIRS